MKKLLYLMLVICLCVVALLDGYANEKTATEPVFLKFVTGSVGGGWYSQAGLLAETIKKGLPEGSDVTVIPGSGVSNIATIGVGNADIGHAHTIYANWAYEGTGPFDTAYPDILGITTLEDNYLLIVATKRSGITSLSEVSEKEIPMRIVTQRATSDGAGMLMAYLSEPYGWGPINLNKPFQDLIGWGGRHIVTTSHSESISNLIDGKGDVWASISSHGAAQVVELQATRDIVFLEIDQEILDFMTEEYGLLQYTVPAGTFGSMDEDYNTISVKSTVAANRNVSEDIVYRVLKSLVDNREELIKAFPKLSAWNPETSWKGIGYDLHPGAIKYFKEMGYME